MNIQELGRKMYLMSFCIVLVLLVLAGCETTKVVTFEPVSAEVVIKETPTNEEGVVDPESNEGRFEPSPVPEFLVYSNQLYGFEFEYPDTWTLLEEDHGVLLMKGRNRLGIRHRWVDEELPPIRTGIPAGDLVYRGKIRFMGTVIPAEFLQFECKNKIVFYGGTGDIEIDDLVFSITLEDRETYDYREIELSEDLLDEAKSIVESFKRIDKSEVSTQAPLAIETGLTAHLELPERFTIGEKIILKFVLKNISETPLYVLSWYTPLEGIREDIFRVTFDGQPLSYKGLCAERISPTADAYVLLYPGEPVSAVVELSESYDFSQAGTYRIEFISPRFSHIARTKGEMVQTREELGPVNIPSNEVSVDLVGSPLGEGLPRLRTPEEAQEMIVAYLRHENRGVGPIIPVEELHIEGLWADLGAQLFRVRKGKILKESFLIRGPNVIQLGAALGGQGVTSLVLADLDQDEQAELYFAYSSGAKNPHSRIGMYVPAYDEKGIYEPAITYFGHLRVYTVDGHSIGVQVVEGDPDTKTLEFYPSIGYLELKKENTEMRLIIHLELGLADEILQKIDNHPTG